MGYYTYYTLSYYGFPEDEQALCDFEPKESDFNLPPQYMKQLIADNGDNDWKWYDWLEDMRKLAKMFPNILFVLDGDGESSGDVWQFRIKGENEFEFHAMEMAPFTNPNLKIKNEK